MTGSNDVAAVHDVGYAKTEQVVTSRRPFCRVTTTLCTLDALGIVGGEKGFAAHIKGQSQSCNVVQGDVAYLPLYMRNKSPVQPCFEGEHLLRPTPLVSKPTHVDCKHPANPSCRVPQAMELGCQRCGSNSPIRL